MGISGPRGRQARASSPALGHCPLPPQEVNHALRLRVDRLLTDEAGVVAEVAALEEKEAALQRARNELAAAKASTAEAASADAAAREGLGVELARLEDLLRRVYPAVAAVHRTASEDRRLMLFKEDGDAVSDVPCNLDTVEGLLSECGLVATAAVARASTVCRVSEARTGASGPRRRREPLSSAIVGAAREHERSLTAHKGERRAAREMADLREQLPDVAGRHGAKGADVVPIIGPEAAEAVKKAAMADVEARLEKAVRASRPMVPESTTSRAGATSASDHQAASGALGRGILRQRPTALRPSARSWFGVNPA